MGKIINLNNVDSDIEQKVNYITNYIDINECYPSDSYYIIEHCELDSDDEFINILCPNCYNPINDETMHNNRVQVHSKVGMEVTEDRKTWGIVEFYCPHCQTKLVVTFE